MDVVIFNRRYNVCPKYPEGTKWEVYVKDRYFSGGWNMKTFDEAIEYLREQYLRNVEDTKDLRRPGDQYCEQEFRGHIDGPGGRMEWESIKELVKKV